MDGPICCNMNSFPVPVRAPDGRLLIVPTGAAVCGPGFESFVDQHILFLVGSDFPGRIVYTTPPELVDKFRGQAIELAEIKAGRELAETKAEIVRIKEEQGVSPELPPMNVGAARMPLPAPAENAVKEIPASNDKPKSVLPEKVTKDNLPGKNVIRGLSKTDLIRVCKDLGWDKVETLSKNQLAARLLQIARD